MMTMTDAKPSRIVGEQYRLDGLCPDCFLPSLWAFPVYVIAGDELILMHTWQACSECHHRERVTDPRWGWIA